MTLADETWLTRFSAEDWLRAAEGEVQRAEVALVNKQQRAGVAQARRAAGMAWNAVLLGITDDAERARYGRSYMDHLRVLKDEATIAPAVREAAAQLVDAPFEVGLVQLGAGDPRLAKAAGLIIRDAAERVAGRDRS